MALSHMISFVEELWVWRRECQDIDTKDCDVITFSTQWLLLFPKPGVPYFKKEPYFAESLKPEQGVN